MPISLTQPCWDTIAPLKPCLRSELRASLQHHDGSDWYVLSDPLAGTHYRFNAAARRVIDAMDGQRTVAELLEAVVADEPDDMRSRSDLATLLAQMQAAELLDWRLPIAARNLLDRLAPGGTVKPPVNPLMVRVPLLDPDVWLERALPWVKPLFTPLMLLAWTLLLAWSVLQAAVHWTALSTDIADRVLTASNLLLLWIVYPVVKLLHELGHAFAVKVRGGEVHEMGVLFLALLPLPYVDASAANAFDSRRSRVLVGAAGIMVDLLMASIALNLWLVSSPGTLLHSVCYNVILIATVSTLLLNANPLMRFDGYYILSDLLAIPNLASRSGRYLLYLLQRHAFGLTALRSPSASRRESLWLLVYGIASFAYRSIVLVVVLWFVAGKYLLAGLLLAVWGAVLMFVRPLVRGLGALLFGPLLAPVRVRALSVSAAFLLATWLAVFAVPLPSWTQAEAVVWLPEKAVVRAGADGFVAEFVAAPGSLVRSGDPLVRSVDPLADARLRRLQAHRDELLARYTALRGSDRAGAARVRDTLRSVEADLARARLDYKGLVASSDVDGYFQPRHGDDLPGRFVRKGEVLGYVTGRVQPRLRAVVAQADIGEVRSGVERLRARLLERSDRTFPVRLAHIVPAAARQLPSAALGTAGGGSVPADPADASGRTALSAVFEVELALPPGIDAHPGARAIVRFDHASEPVGRRWLATLNAAIERRLAKL